MKWLISASLALSACGAMKTKDPTGGNDAAPPIVPEETPITPSENPLPTPLPTESLPPVVVAPEPIPTPEPAPEPSPEPIEVVIDDALGGAEIKGDSFPSLDAYKARVKGKWLSICQVSGNASRRFQITLSEIDTNKIFLTEWAYQNQACKQDAKTVKIEQMRLLIESKADPERKNYWKFKAAKQSDLNSVINISLGYSSAEGVVAVSEGEIRRYPTGPF